MKSKNQGRIAVPSKEQLVIAFMVSVVVLTLNVASFDPFNIPKFVTLGITACISLYFILRFPPILSNFDRILLLLAGLFLTGLALSTLNHGDKWRSIVGTYGRNMGILTYLFLVIIFLSTAFSKNGKLNDNHLFIFLPLCLFITFYGTIQFSGDDPFRWNNPYSPIIGTFGNPNFMSAFLGTSIVICVAILVNIKKISLGWRFVIISLAATAIFLILESRSIQGFLFAYLGIVVMSNLHFMSKLKIRLLVGFLTVASSILGILGLLNRGPLAEYLYAPSISARGDYWRAAVRMSKDFPLFGVGIEKYGDFFPQYRDLQQVQGRNWATYSDNAHNVFLQIASTSGIITAFSLALLHLVIWTMTFSKLRAAKSIEERNTLIALLSISVASSSPMLISVDNIGVAAVSWFNLGLLYSGIRHFSLNNHSSNSRGKSTSIFPSLISITVLSVLAISVLIPVAKADLEFTRFLKQSTSSNLSDAQQEIFFTTITKLRPSEYRYQILFARKYAETGNLQKARDIYSRILKNSPNNAEIYRMIAQTYEVEGNTSKELEFRVKSQERDYYRMDNLLSLVKIYAKLGKEQETMKYFDIMHKTLPKYPYTLEAKKVIMESFPK
jgi:O-antigen ligase